MSECIRSLSFMVLVVIVSFISAPQIAGAGNEYQLTEGKKPVIEYGGEWMVKYDIAEITAKPQAGKAVVQAFFTTKPDALYAVTPHWPGKELGLKVSKPEKNTVITMLGTDEKLNYKYENGTLNIDISTITADKLPCNYGYTFRISPAVIP